MEAKVIVQPTPMVKLQRGEKIITRPLRDYKLNKAMWEFRGYKIHEESDTKAKSNIEKVAKKNTKSSKGKIDG